jgi:hypothetical protein
MVIPRPSPKKVCIWMMRYRFNALRIAERAARGAISTEIIDQGPAPRESGEPRGTRSQFVYYRISGQDYAKCHRHLRPDSTTGGSGRPDPKWLRVGGEIWKLRHEDVDEPCPDCGEWRRRNTEWLTEQGLEPER